MDALTCRHIDRAHFPFRGICAACLDALAVARRRAQQTAYAIEAAQVREGALAYDDRVRAGLIRHVGGTCRPERLAPPPPAAAPWLDALGHAQDAERFELRFERER